MFTRIVLETGGARRARWHSEIVDIDLEGARFARELRGDSVAVNGVCLTATGTERRRFASEVLPETQAVSTLGKIERARRVNLELLARPTDGLGGDLLQEHAEGTVTVSRNERMDGTRRVWVGTEDEDIIQFPARKGSVAPDGVSLKVADVGQKTFQVALIPQALDATTLTDLAMGSTVSLEVDAIAKCVERPAEPLRRDIT